jgi:hypothetical protein
VTEPTRRDRDDRSDVFAREAEAPAPGLVREFVQFLLENKKWWLIPIIVALLLVTVLVILSSTAAAPFIYTIF